MEVSGPFFVEDSLALSVAQFSPFIHCEVYIFTFIEVRVGVFIKSSLTRSALRSASYLISFPHTFRVQALACTSYKTAS